MIQITHATNISSLFTSVTYVCYTPMALGAQVVRARKQGDDSNKFKSNITVAGGEDTSPTLNSFALLAFFSLNRVRKLHM